MSSPTEVRNGIEGKYAASEDIYQPICLLFLEKILNFQHFSVGFQNSFTFIRRQKTGLNQGLGKLTPYQRRPFQENRSYQSAAEKVRFRSKNLLIISPVAEATVNIWRTVLPFNESPNAVAFIKEIFKQSYCSEDMLFFPYYLPRPLPRLISFLVGG